jgi:hypothetical protein
MRGVPRPWGQTRTYDLIPPGVCPTAAKEAVSGRARSVSYQIQSDLGSSRQNDATGWARRMTRARTAARWPRARPARPARARQRSASTSPSAQPQSRPAPPSRRRATARTTPRCRPRPAAAAGAATAARPLPTPEANADRYNVPTGLDVTAAAVAIDVLTADPQDAESHPGALSLIPTPRTVWR